MTKTKTSYKCYFPGVDTMEKGALVGMMALAASDFLFCLVTITGTYQPAQYKFYEKDFSYFYTLYGNFVQNTLIKTSTWFTVILAVSRYIVVSNPVKARQCMRCIHTVIAILTCTVIWILLHIPLIYIWKVITIYCPVPIIYILISGIFNKNQTLNSVFTYIWGILGFIVPIFILAYCNFKLIHSLRLSRKLRKQRQEGQRKCSDSNYQKFITVTLISIVFMYFLLVMPSELVHFYGDIIETEYTGTYRILLITSNLLQAVNFSMNFVLYCFINQYFRKVIKLWSSKVPLLKKLIQKSQTAHSRSSLNQSSTRSKRSSITSKITTI